MTQPARDLAGLTKYDRVNEIEDSLVKVKKQIQKIEESGTLIKSQKQPEQIRYEEDRLRKSREEKEEWNEKDNRIKELTQLRDEYLDMLQKKKEQPEPYSLVKETRTSKALKPSEPDNVGGETIVKRTSSVTTQDTLTKKEIGNLRDEHRKKYTIPEVKELAGVVREDTEDEIRKIITKVEEHMEELRKPDKLDADDVIPVSKQPISSSLVKEIPKIPTDISDDERKILKRELEQVKRNYEDLLRKQRIEQEVKYELDSRVKPDKIVCVYLFTFCILFFYFN